MMPLAAMLTSLVMALAQIGNIYHTASMHASYAASS